MKVYIPKEYNDYYCITVQSSNSFRAYKTIPILNESIEYTDIYFKSDYLSKKGIETLTSFNPNDCLSITNDILYRYDFNDILLTLILLTVGVFSIPFILLSRFFKRLRK